MDLDKLRKKINKLDKQLIDTLNERTKVAMEIGAFKKENGMEFYAPHREQQVFQKVRNLNKGPVTNESLQAIYREIMSSSLHLEKPLVISYLGPEASYTNQAAIKKFGSSLKYSPQSTIEDVFMEVAHNKADYGVVPIENTMEGAVYHTLDMFATSDLKICAQIELPITYHLLGNSPLSEIEKIYANSQAMGLCRAWLRSNAPEVQLVEAKSSIQAAEKAKGKKKAAAIANILATDKYDLEVIAEDIQSVVRNTTRYLVLSQDYAEPSGNDKTSIMFGTYDEVGSLVDVLQTIRDYDINMSKIESRPSKRKAWDYYFFVDFYGHCEDEEIKKALKDISKNSSIVKILGSYPNIDG